MKKLLVWLFIISSTAVFAQDNSNHHDRDVKQNNNNSNDVPDEVRRSFHRDNPDVQNPQWNSTNGQWRSTYKDGNNRDVESYYDNNGQIIDTHIPYSQNELPSRVRDRAHRKYHADENYDAYRIERPNSQPLFQLRIQSGRTIYMDENGRKRKYRDRH